MTPAPLLTTNEASDVVDLLLEFGRRNSTSPMIAAYWSDVVSALQALATGRTRTAPVLSEAEWRERFEAWYAANAFDLVSNPIGSRECSHHWSAWFACARFANLVADEPAKKEGG